MIIKVIRHSIDRTTTMLTVLTWNLHLTIFRRGTFIIVFLRSIVFLGRILLRICISCSIGLRIILFGFFFWLHLIISIRVFIVISSLLYLKIIRILVLLVNRNLVWLSLRLIRLLGLHWDIIKGISVLLLIVNRINIMAKYSVKGHK